MLLNISQQSSQTLQEQIIGQIRARILAGELEANQSLMSIRALSQNLRVSINTVQRAYEHLLRENLIYSRAGKGFFVIELKQQAKSELARERFKGSLQSLVNDALQEGLSKSELKQVFKQINTGE